VALHGDLRTFALPDLLQWLDASHRPGRLSVSYGGGERIFYLGESGIERFGAVGLYERLARIVRLLGLIDDQGASIAVEQARAGKRLEDAFTLVGVPTETLRTIAHDDIFQSATDLFEEAGGTFHFSDDPELEDDETVRVEIPIREILYESVRRLDEAAAAKDAITGDDIFLRPGKPADGAVAGRAAAARASIGRNGAPVGAVRLALGISKGCAARILYDLWRGGFLKIEGGQIPPAPDPLTHMLRQGERLLADGHFEAASLVFNSLLAADPSDRRVREFARAVAREHVESLYRKLLPVLVPDLTTPESSLAALRPDERIVASLVNGKWDVSTLVLASPLRELQTLRAIERMVELGFVALRG